MDITTFMLQVLDEPTELRIIADTKCPLIGTDDFLHFMIDRGRCETYKGANDAETYNEWRMSDNTGNQQTFRSNRELLDFFDEYDEIFEEVYVEGF